MGKILREGSTLIWRENQEQLWIRPWGRDGLRVQANLTGAPLDLPQALLIPAPAGGGKLEIEMRDGEAAIRNGKIRAALSPAGQLRFSSATGEFLREADEAVGNPPRRSFRHRDGGLFRIEASFEASDGERFYGLGQHLNGRLDQKGCVIDLRQRNTAVAIPFLVSSRMYGFLWNNPAVGRVELGHNGTRWVAEGASQLDYYVVCGDTCADILERYADVTGHAPPLPDWALGFWQSKLRYETQAELLEVAREYKKRGLPLDVIVSDFFHWSHMGDWRFDPACWPDPAAMTRELEELGVKLMVSIWPTVSPLSENYSEMRERGLLINNEHGVEAQQVFLDHGVNGPAYYPYVDATNPEARRFLWETVRRNYFSQGVKGWWLDNDEPDVNPYHPENLRFHLGNGIEVANIYPLLHLQGFYEGLRAEGETEILMLSRSAWAGAQRYGPVIWSGDIASTFESLQAQVRAGMNMAMSGIPWWTTDIGGFHGGDIHTEYFRELIVRWFQYGVFCPVLRMHGYREPVKGPMPASGAGNEIWSFGEDVYGILRGLLLLRERLRPYIRRQMPPASEKGIPPMRPLFFDFPQDAECAGVEDQFMFGRDILVAPVLEQGARERAVYLPDGTAWIDARTGRTLPGGRRIIASAPLDAIPVFLRPNSGLEQIFTA
ncbi:MAG: TIM-barrel domain-containing protein [Anaerolineales bacterium]